MSLTLSPEWEARVREKVEAGLYRDAEELVRKALESLERDPAARAVPLRAAIQRGFDDYEAGRYTVINNLEELEAFFQEI